MGMSAMMRTSRSVSAPAPSDSPVHRTQVLLPLYGEDLADPRPRLDASLRTGRQRCVHSPR